MLKNLVSFSLRFRLVVLVVAAILLVAGLMAVRSAPWDVFPQFAPPLVTVQTEAPGLSTEEVERLVTVPIESSVNGVSRLAVLRSSSAPGLSVVTAIFEEGTDILQARQLVTERLAAESAQLPEGVGPPRLVPLVSSMSRLVTVGLTSERVGPMELRTLADRLIARRLRAVPGVAQVTVFGGEVKQYQVLVDPLRLAQQQVTLDQVLTAAGNATAFGGVGFVETPNQRLPIRQRTRLESAEDLAAVPVAFQDGVALTLGRVAKVAPGAADKVGDATVNGRPGVILIVDKQPSANTLEVTQSVQAAIDGLRAALPEGVELHPALFRQAAFVERAIGNLTTALVIGCVLVSLVLVAFLFQWRTVVISLTAIPLSLVGAILVLRFFGASLNTMTLGGLAIALGEVVDDAIVDVENVFRRWRENRQRPDPRPALEVVLNASLEVRSAVVYASFIVMLVFLPVFFLGDLAGTLFRPLGHAYVAAILVSLAVALTVTPAMCLILLKTSGAERRREPLLVRILKRIYAAVLPGFLEHPRWTVGLATVLLAVAIGAVPFLGGEFLPDFRESNFVVFMAGKPDSSLAESVRAGRRVAAKLKAIPGVVSVGQQIGRADLSEDTWGPNLSEVWIVLDDAAPYDETLAKIREALDEMPGYLFEAKQFLRERIDEVLTGSTADIVIRVAGPDLAVLRAQGTKIAESIRGVAGVRDLRVEQQVDVPQIDIALDPRATARRGFSVGEVNRAVKTLLRGTRVGQVYEDDWVFDVVVRAEPSCRDNPAILGQLALDGPGGEKVPLRAVASIDIADSPNVINREEASRRLLVTCNAEGRDVAGVMHDIQQRIAADVPRLPSGYHLEFGGEYQARAEASRRLMLLGAASVLGIFMLLYLDFQSVRLALVIMASVPLAAVGGVAAVFLGGGNVSLGSLVGFVTVFGIAVRNGILLVSHYQHLQSEEGMAFGGELLLRGARERLVPIVMTASTAALGLLPLVVLGNRPGHEIEHPMAVVILGGLVSSTFLTLLVLPALYRLAGAGRE
ncbi:MAG: efflux RND transporter permease subunit [Pirellulales bacterium]